MSVDLGRAYMLPSSSAGFVAILSAIASESNTEEQSDDRCDRATFLRVFATPTP